MKPDPKPSALANAINYMNRLIAAGIDYSEAQWRVSQCYPQFSDDVIAEAYDQQFEEKVFCSFCEMDGEPMSDCPMCDGTSRVLKGN